MSTTTAGRALPTRIGPYDIIQLLGEGGMGIVYEAEETHPVRRRVALKLVRTGLDSAEILGRFDAERRALAVMNHRGIAKVLQAGSTEQGQPYFAMELVRGLPITQFADHRRLSVRDRLALFIEVCEAVQHAHQKGVIHRDLKPSNILVTDEDGRSQPKIIDFGISKAVSPLGGDALVRTQHGLALGTIAYMSPEQADADGGDVDTRADIYSLGVMLYELLVGHLPLDPADVGLFVFLARLAAGESNPPTPSDRLSTLEREREQIAKLRRTDVPHLRRALKGDLDWIIMRAMHPDRAQRYETATGLAADIRRHLADEPIVARPPSARYRLGKFVRRHRVGVAAAAIVSTSVVAGAVVATVGLVRAVRAERLAAREAQAATAVTDFLVGLFKVSDPGASRGATLTAREILERGTERVATELDSQPELRTRIQQVLGTVQFQLGNYVEARGQLEAALRAREQVYGAEHPLVGETLAALAEVARTRGEYDEADRLFTRALAIQRASIGGESKEVATTLALLAATRVRQGRPAEAESLYKAVLALDARVRDRADPRLARDMRGLAAVYMQQKRWTPAESLLKEVLALQEATVGSDHPDLASTLSNLGAVYFFQGRYDRALPFYKRARPIMERALGEEHPQVSGVINNTAEVAWKLGDHGAADSLFRRALAMKRKAFAPTNPSIAITLNQMAGLRRDEGRWSESEALYREALALRERVLGASHPDVGETLRDYAAMLRKAGRGDEAALLEERAARIR
ncbi:MAG: serine/threonine-protein kinase [Gemmatimonadaceae bacterium]|jgi:non-specific serine/threonine protein kinase/serine/threonine-protein kinase|nr:serine/threonine-protein kinase [Gemmatimonadaceae bacterium]